MQKANFKILGSLILVNLLFCSLVQPHHAIYLSVTELNLVEKKPIDFTVKVFSDDLQDALRNFNTKYQTADIGSFFFINESIAVAYFNEHFIISAGTIQIDYTLLSHSIESDAHFITFRLDQTIWPKNFMLKADFLMELFPTQKNIVKIRQGDNIKYLKFELPVHTQVVTLDH